MDPNAGIKIGLGIGVTAVLTAAGVIGYKRYVAKNAVTTTTPHQPQIDIAQVQASTAQTSVTLAAIAEQGVDMNVVAEESLDAIIDRDWQRAYDLVCDLVIGLYESRINTQRALISNYEAQIAAKQASLSSLQAESRRTAWSFNAAWDGKGDMWAKYPGSGRSVMKLNPASWYKDSRQYETEYLAALKDQQNIPTIVGQIANANAEIKKLEDDRIAFSSRRGSLYSKAEASFKTTRSTADYDTAVNKTKKLVNGAL